MLSQRSLQLSSFLLILFYFFSASVISATLSSSLLLQFSVSFSLLSIPSSVFFISVFVFFISDCSLYFLSLCYKLLTFCSLHPFFWFFWSFLQLLPLSLSWVGCLSPFHLFLLELYLAASLQHVSVTSFCLTCCFYFVFSTDSLVTCPDLDQVAFCRSRPVPPSSTLPSCHQT